MKKILTLCFIYDDARILLGKKKRGFGEGKWNGYGGKVEEGETIEAAAKREMLEECGVRAEELEPRGVLTFIFNTIPDNELEVHIFRVTKWSGEPMETEEMVPGWFAFADIPYDSMWVDDAHWLPLLLQGKSIKARFVFENDTTKSGVIVEHSLEIIE